MSDIEDLNPEHMFDHLKNIFNEKAEDRRIIEMEFTPIKNIRIIETNEEEIKNIANENKEDNI